ncbi:NAD(P)-dependent oxidoreductase [Devosia riboflavina]
MTKTTLSADASTKIAVLGLGEMGAAIAKTFVGGGFPTTVWNRTASKSAVFLDTGAKIAPTAAEAAADSDVVVLCLLDSLAVNEVLRSLDSAISGKVLVNLTSGAPAQARTYHKWAKEHGAAYLDGKIMGDPPYVGTPQVNFSFSGSAAAFAVHETALQSLGTIGYHGDEAGAAAVEFMAQVAVGYEMLIGFLHTLRLVEAEGFDVEYFAERVGASMAGYPGLLKMMARAVSTGEYRPDLGSLDVQVALMDDMISHRESMGVEAMRMREVKSLMDQRIAQGLGDQGFSSLFELLIPKTR